MKRLLKQQMPVLTTGCRTPLHLAAMHGHVACVNELLDCKIPIDTQDLDGETALHFAAWHDKEACVEELLKHGAAMEITNSVFGITPLHAAAENNRDACVKVLIIYGVNQALKDDNGRTARATAKSKAAYDCMVKAGRAERVLRLVARKKIAQEVLEKSVNVDVKDLVDLIASYDDLR